MGWIAWERFAVMEMFGGQHEQSLLIDKASLLNQEQMNGIAKYHSAFLDAYDIDFRVVTTTGAEDINLYSVKSFEELQVGTFSTTGRGLLLVVDPENDLVRMENGAWKLDLTMMSNAIRFNHKNQWHFAMNVSHPYGFAFSDWRFDQHGFPRLR